MSRILLLTIRASGLICRSHIRMAYRGKGTGCLVSSPSGYCHYFRFRFLKS